MIQVEDIGQETCEPVAGLTPTAYYSLWGDYDTITDPKDICGTVVANNFAELVEIPADPGHTLKAGKYMNKIDFITETGGITSTMVGEKGRRLFENEIEIQIGGSDATLLGFLRWIKNQKLVFHVEEFGSGQLRQLGSSRLPAWAEGVEHAIEAVLEGQNSVTITIKDKQKWPAAIYLGDVVLNSASS